MAPTWGPVAFLQGSLESDFYYMHTCVGNEESNQEDLCRWSSNNNAGRNNPKLLCPVWRGRGEGGSGKGGRSEVGCCSGNCKISGD